jgi:23S rRNA pseudouridine1911/1915/1917 synthase
MEKRRKTSSGGESSEPPPRRRHEAVVGTEAGGRADRYIAEVLALLSRSQLKARGAEIEVEGRPAKLSRILRPGERLVVTWTEEASPGLIPEDLPLDILHEDLRTIVINKAQGMVTHPGNGNRRGTLANAILGHFAANRAEASGRPGSEASDVPRGGIVHRLDKDTSGVIIAAKDSEAQAWLSSQFKDRSVRKEYLAITKGVPVGLGGHIENRLARDHRDRRKFAETESGGRVAISDWRALAIFGDYALLCLRPRTGRTHQLRVHLAGLGTPILGDPIYGKRDSRYPDLSLKLHAWKLAIRLPGAREATIFSSAPPPAFLALLRVLEAAYGKKKPRDPIVGA